MVENQGAVEIRFPDSLGSIIYISDPDGNLIEVDQFDTSELDHLLPLAELDNGQSDAIINELFGNGDFGDAIDLILMDDWDAQMDDQNNEHWLSPDRLRYNPKEGF